MKDNFSLFTRFFIAFLSLFAIPLILVCLILNVHTGNFYLTLTEENMQSSLSATVKNGEVALKVAENIVLNITTNEKLIKASQLSVMDSMNADEIYFLYDALDVLSGLEVGKQNVDSVLIYNSESESVLSSEKRLDDVSEYINSAWYNAYSENRDTLVWTYEKADAYGKPAMIAMVYPAASFKGAIVVNIPVGYLVGHISEYDDGFIVLPNTEEVVSFKDTEGVNEELFIAVKNRIGEYSKREGVFSVEENGEKLIVVYDTSDYGNFKFVSLRSEMKSYQRISNLTGFIVVFALLMLVIGVFVCYFLSKQFYNPIKKLVNNIKESIHTEQANESEWKYIESAIERFSHQEKELKAFHEKKRLDEKVMLMKRIVSDGIERCEDYYEIFTFEYYRVIILEIDSEEEFRRSYSLEERGYVMNLVLTVAKDILNSKEDILCDGFAKEDSIILIVNSKSAQSDSEAELLKLILSEAKKILKLSASIAVGKVSKEGGVSNSLESAKEAFLEKYILGSGNVIFAEKCSVEELNVEFDESELINNVKLLNQESVFAQLRGFVDELIKTRNAEFAKQQLWLVMLSLLNYAKEYNIPTSLLSNQQSMLSEFMSCNTIEKAYIMLCDLSERIMKYFEVSTNGDAYRQRIMNYVHTHYNEDIDVYNMAHNLNISYSLLRRLFIEYTGENIMIYTNALRIEKARELLKTTDKSLQEIAVEIGYNTTQSFNRNFKRFEGITPGEYRKRMYQKGQQ